MPQKPDHCVSHGTDPMGGEVGLEEKRPLCIRILDDIWNPDRGLDSQTSPVHVTIGNPDTQAVQYSDASSIRVFRYSDSYFNLN